MTEAEAVAKCVFLPIEGGVMDGVDIRRKHFFLFVIKCFYKLCLNIPCGGFVRGRWFIGAAIIYAADVTVPKLFDDVHDDFLPKIKK